MNDVNDVVDSIVEGFVGATRLVIHTVALGILTGTFVAVAVTVYGQLI